MEINIEKLIEIIVREVITELLRRGEVIGPSSNEIKTICPCNSNNNKNKERAVIDLSNYKTPLLTENHLTTLDKAIVEIVVPKGTIISPNAKDIIKKRNLVIINN